MKKRFLWLFLGLILVANLAGAVWSDEVKEPCTIMHPDRETLQRWIQDYEKAPRAYIDKALSFSIPLKGSLSLLSHLKYTPSERNQGSCGNCWAWAGTGIMEVALDVEEGIRDRLSIQYLNSCGDTGFDYACCGGNLSDVVDFYTSAGQAIPWSNTNASWQDGARDCGSGSSVSCGSISVSPNYTITRIEEQTIETQRVGQAQAIANIKNVLNQNRAVWFAFFLATGDDWNNFFDFWNNDGESSIWNPDYSCGHTWDSGGGGHAVLCVGYNDDDPENSYWIIVNTWGTAGGKRPNGIFRMDMNMDYDCTFYDRWSRYWSFYWQTLDIEYGDSPTSGPTVTTGSATSVTSDSATLNGTVNPNGASATYYFEYGTTESYGSNTVTKSAGSGTGNVSVNAAITGLSPNTACHYRIVAANSGGTSYGSDRTFYTSASALPPTVTTGLATSVTSDSATLNGTVNPNGAWTMYRFEYGTTTNYGSSAGDRFAGSGTGNVSVNAAITGISPNTTYHYRIVGTNSGGTSYGSDQTFTTEKKDMPWLQPLLLDD